MTSWNSATPSDPSAASASAVFLRAGALVRLYPRTLREHASDGTDSTICDAKEKEERVLDIDRRGDRHLRRRQADGSLLGRLCRFE